MATIFYWISSLIVLDWRYLVLNPSLIINALDCSDARIQRGSPAISGAYQV